MRQPASEEDATPSAVETTPSIPLTPRLASTRGGPVTAGANHSRSRMGMDADTTRAASNSAAQRCTARATCGSPRSLPSAPAMAACARSSHSCHDPSHSGSQGDAFSKAAIEPGVGRAEVELRRDSKGIGPLPPGIDDDDPGSGGGGIGDVLTERPREPRRADHDDGLSEGRMRADDGVRGCDRADRPASRPRVGHDRPPESLGESEHPVGLGRPGRQAAGHDDPAAPEWLPDRAARLIRRRRPSDPGRGGSSSALPIKGSRKARLR